MKKKVILGKKLFLKKETITGLTDVESLSVNGGYGRASSPSAGCLAHAPQTGTVNTCEAPVEGGFGSLQAGGCVVISTKIGVSCYHECGRCA